MRYLTKTAWIILFLLVISVSSAGAAASGYTYDDSVDYEWYDLKAASGTKSLSIGNDQIKTDPIDIGFDFEFFGEKYRDIYVSSEGFISFSEGQPIGKSVESLPNPTGKVHNLIAGLWSNLQPDG
jgi:hypothetical protein